jgi:phosphatidylinositol-3-phosphatase
MISAKSRIMTVLTIIALAAAPLSIIQINDTAFAVSTSATIKHTIIIVLENKSYSQVYGSSSAPYMNSIANKYTLLTNYYATTHPSLPNYIAMIAGSTFGITDDSAPSSHTSIAGNKEIVSLLKQKAVSWKTYQESMPSSCYKTSSGLYAVKHNPFVYFSDVTAKASYCKAHVVDFNALNKDLTNNALPQYAFITPNLKDDGHDTSVSYADNWLKGFLPKLINSPSFANSVIFVTFDEDNKSSGNHVYTAVVGPSTIVKQAYKSSTKYTHYSLLATIENIYGLGNLGRNDASASVMSDVFSDSSTGGYHYNLYFTASGSNYFDVASTSSQQLSKWSISAWFRTLSDFSSNAIIANKGGSGSETSGENMNYGLLMTATKQLRAGFEESTGVDHYVTSPKAYNDGNWHYAVATYDGATLRLYVDGTQVASAITSAIPDMGGMQAFRVGANSLSANNFFIGNIDEVRVYDRALTSSEVSTQTAGTSFSTSGQVVYLPF